MKLGLLSLALLAAGASAASAQTLLYQQSFESGTIGPEWSSNSRISNGYPYFTFFNGRYSGGSTTLTLPQPPGSSPNGINTNPGDTGGGGGGGGGGNPPPPGGYFRQYTLSFDFYCIDSWDGDSLLYGSDRLRVLINDAIRFDETFSNQPGNSQSFRAASIGPVHMDYNAGAMDSIYRQISIDFTVPTTDPTIRFTWADGGLQGMNDESWGIDNIRVTYQTVPAPGAGLALLAAGGLVARRRR